MGNVACCLDTKTQKVITKQKHANSINQKQKSIDIESTKQYSVIEKDLNANKGNNNKISKQYVEIPRVLDKIDMPVNKMSKQIKDKQSDELIDKKYRQILRKHTTIQQYKNFVKLKLVQQNSFPVADILNGICLVIFQVLNKNKQQSLKILQQIIFIQQFPKLRQSSYDRTIDYGQVSSDQLLKIFLQYVIKLDTQKAQQILQKYSIIQSVLQRVVIAYLLFKTPSNQKQSLLKQYLSQNISTRFLMNILKVFKIKYEWRQDYTVLDLNRNYIIQSEPSMKVIILNQ